MPPRPQRGKRKTPTPATITPKSSENFAITYSGENNYAQVSAFSNFLTGIIPDFSLNIPSTPFNVPAGQSGTLQIRVVPPTNNSSPATLTCNRNPACGHSIYPQPS